MISLDQVILLEQKVESAVAKIQQLQAENDALRSKCEQLTNALSAKSEQLTTFETDQNQIEDGIKKALDRLNAIENSVLRTAKVMAGGQAASPIPTPKPQPVQAQPIQPKVIIQEEPVIEEPVVQESVIQEEPVIEEPAENNFEEVFAPSFDTMEPTEEVPEDTFNPDFDDTPVSEEDNQDGLGFDIF